MKKEQYLKTFKYCPYGRRCKSLIPLWLSTFPSVVRGFFLVKKILAQISMIVNNLSK